MAREMPIISFGSGPHANSVTEGSLMLAESEDFVLFSGAIRTVCGTPQRSQPRVIHWLRPLCFAICLSVSSLLTLTVCAQEIKPISPATGEAEHSAAASTTEEHQLSQKAVEIGRV